MASFLRGIKNSIKSLARSKEERRHAMVGPAKLWEMKRDFQIQFLKSMGLKPEHYFLDIGCGTLRGGIPLIDYLDAGRYFGLEVREEALEEGRKELSDAGLENKKPELLLCPDITQLSLDQRFDYAWGFSVLIHMSDDILEQTLGFVGGHLSEHGTLYANVNIGDRKEGHWQGFPVVSRTLAFYQEVGTRCGLAVSDIGPLRDHGHVSNVEQQDSQRLLKMSKI